MVNRSLLFAAVILFTVTALEHAPAVWRGPPQMLAALDDETRNWVTALQNKRGGPCCDTLTVSPSRSMAGIWRGPSMTPRD